MLLWNMAGAAGNALLLRPGELDLVGTMPWCRMAVINAFFFSFLGVRRGSGRASGYVSVSRSALPRVQRRPPERPRGAPRVSLGVRRGPVQLGLPVVYTQPIQPNTSGVW